MSTRTQAQLSMSTGTQALKHSMSNYWAQSSQHLCQHRHEVLIINAKPMGMISARIFQRGLIYHCNQSGVYTN